ncbi:MAG: GTPase HflX [Acidimicrobiia bacterium]|nr:GTPase HflX [Acidimicrobiia bacterium]
MTDAHLQRGRRRLTATVTDLDVARQRAMLVALSFGSRTTAEVEAGLDELALLTETAGSEPVERSMQQRDPDPATYFGKGKTAELASLAKALDIDVVVVDGSLSPVQQRNLQQAFGCDVVDRTALILDIFAQHAHSREGMAQVELALLRYRLPRLRGKGTVLSRLGGGIGTRGPGETQLETDRRKVTGRISTLERQMKDMQTGRDTRRKARRRSGLPTVALVGYTNAGKSSLLNRLTDAGVLVENQLFSTLDATTRRLGLPGGRTALISDTVGFVRDLPHELVEAFRTTLEEAVDTDLLVHVVDASNPHAEAQIAAVRATLADIGAAEVPEVIVFNKSDLASDSGIARLTGRHSDGLIVSASTGAGMPALLETLEDRLAPATVELDVLIPYGRGDLVAEAHRIGEVVTETHETTGTRLTVRIPSSEAGAFTALSD